MKIGRLVLNDVSVMSYCIVDLFTTDNNDDSTPMKVPANINDPVAWLTNMFSGFKDTWTVTHSQFQQLPDDVIPAFFFYGDVTNLTEIADISNYHIPNEIEEETP